MNAFFWMSSGATGGFFIRRDELEASWDVFTPVLHKIDARKVKPEPYEYGICGPVSAAQLGRRHGF